ncbi:hypothetical protein [Bacillus pumilus]|uniref:hypothetical protein n=1 Tax=Bacillus pumilus TaxID=1408 RepID=UPI00119F3C67|nr:hypothetical protein [Bacillus pumilus]
MAALKGVKTLDMVGGKITKVAYEGAEYERVEGDAQVGDLFLPRKGFHDMTAGSFYSVKEVDPDGNAYFFDDGGWSAVICSDDYFSFRKKRVRLKVGDYAKVVDSTEQQNVDVGDIVEITKDDRSEIPFMCEIVAGIGAGSLIWAEESELVLATEAEVAAAKEAEAKWAKIGRKVDEYKVGDIVQFKDDYVAIGVVEDVGVRLLSVRMPDEAYQSPYKNNVTLITPVEARFDRS